MKGKGGPDNKDCCYRGVRQRNGGNVCLFLPYVSLSKDFAARFATIKERIDATSASQNTEMCGMQKIGRKKSRTSIYGSPFHTSIDTIKRPNLHAPPPSKASDP
ncbi:hypothetical protein CJ030_MR0G025665 [Morella rubra]|uniref:Uncharacterized protein n=1 Tax=Morella rubra TaxID=262757 RepID=A0A6A1UG18_9ROSI|nr:hypothetical protein CJ030_MR0G025665 [Morella rubra]